MVGSSIWITLATSGIAAAVVSFAFNLAAENRKLLRSKAEMLLEDNEELRYFWINHVQGCLLYLDGHNTERKWLEQSLLEIANKTHAELRSIDNRRFSTVFLYFPELLDANNDILALESSLNALLTDVINGGIDDDLYYQGLDFELDKLSDRLLRYAIGVKFVMMRKTTFRGFLKASIRKLEHQWLVIIGVAEREEKVSVEL